MAEPRSVERRTRKRTPRSQTLELRLTFDDRSGLRQVLAATLADLSDGGIGVTSRAPLPVGLWVGLKPSQALTTAVGPLPPKARVAWSVADPAVGYRGGLAFEVAQKQARPEADGLPAADNDLDLYEILQVNPKAEPETIHRVYRILAQRYHPDNQETGDEDLFKQVLKAYRILSDPAQRAGYDVQNSSKARSRVRLFENAEATLGVEGEKRKRRGILALLYARRLQRPDAPLMNAFEMEDALEVPREHLEFTIWYLKENGLITRSDNNRFSITVKGVDYAEQLEATSPTRLVDETRLLPAAQRSA